MFERFTDRARRVVVLAQEEARMLNHNYIGTEHILLGLIHEGEGVAAKALESLGISLDAVRQQVEEIIGQGQQAPSEMSGMCCSSPARVGDLRRNLPVRSRRTRARACVFPADRWGSTAARLALREIRPSPARTTVEVQQHRRGRSCTCRTSPSARSPAGHAV